MTSNQKLCRFGPMSVEGIRGLEAKGERKTIQATLGVPFTIRIWEDRTRGERYIPAFDPQIFKLLDEDYRRTINIRVADTGMRLFTFAAQQPGSQEIVFERRYGWKFAAEERIIYTVEVQPG